MANSFDLALSDLAETVTEVTGVLDSATAFILGIPALIQAAVDAASLTPDQAAQFTALNDAIRAEAAELAQAIATNP